MEIRVRLDSTDRKHATPDQIEQKKIKRIVQLNIMRLFIKSDRTKTLRGQQFRKPQDIKKRSSCRDKIYYLFCRKLFRISAGPSST